MTIEAEVSISLSNDEDDLVFSQMEKEYIRRKEMEKMTSDNEFFNKIIKENALKEDLRLNKTPEDRAHIRK